MSLFDGSLAILAAVSLLSGFIDAVVGGGGLIQLPALFAVLPREIPAVLFGTNKIASVVGTSSAAWRYTRRIDMPWRVTLPAAVMAFASSYLGAMCVAWLPRDVLRPLILFLLIAAAIYTFRRRDFGAIHAPRLSARQSIGAALLMGVVLGFYDGFFGPGTGSLLIFLLIRVFGFDFLHASAAAKIINVATNLAAISFFVPGGYFLPLAALVMASANVVGSLIGTHLALRHGSGFVRRIFLIVVTLLIGRFAWDTFGH